jgi:hypothetical protein
MEEKEIQNIIFDKIVILFHNSNEILINNELQTKHKKCLFCSHFRLK